MGAENPNNQRKFTCVVLCGGQSLRTRFDLAGVNKLLAPISGTPLLHHVLNTYYSTQLFNKFILCLGNERDVFQESLVSSPNYVNGQWNGVDLMILETGIDVTATDRIYQSKKHIDDDVFFLSYGDVLSNINFREMLTCHTRNKCEITIALVKAKMPYGRVLIDNNNKVYEFIEKPILEHWINAGYFILNKNVFTEANINLEYEREFLPKFIEKKEKVVLGYKHYDYWKGIDTYKDIVELRNEWEEIKQSKLFPTQEVL